MQQCWMLRSKRIGKTVFLFTSLTVVLLSKSLCVFSCSLRELWYFVCSEVLIHLFTWNYKKNKNLLVFLPFTPGQKRDNFELTGENENHAHKGTKKIFPRKSKANLWVLLTLRLKICWFCTFTAHHYKPQPLNEQFFDNWTKRILFNAFAKKKTCWFLHFSLLIELSLCSCLAAVSPGFQFFKT
jgi:hypothetical protein